MLKRSWWKTWRDGRWGPGMGTPSTRWEPCNNQGFTRNWLISIPRSTDWSQFYLFLWTLRAVSYFCLLADNRRQVDGPEPHRVLYPHVPAWGSQVFLPRPVAQDRLDCEGFPCSRCLYKLIKFRKSLGMVHLARYVLEYLGYIFQRNRRTREWEWRGGARGPLRRTWRLTSRRSPAGQMTSPPAGKLALCQPSILPKIVFFPLPRYANNLLLMHPSLLYFAPFAFTLPF